MTSLCTSLSPKSDQTPTTESPVRESRFRGHSTSGATDTGTQGTSSGSHTATPFPLQPRVVLAVAKELQVFRGQLKPFSQSTLPHRAGREFLASPASELSMGTDWDRVRGTRQGWLAREASQPGFPREKEAALEVRAQPGYLASSDRRWCRRDRDCSWYPIPAPPAL